MGLGKQCRIRSAKDGIYWGPDCSPLIQQRSTHLQTVNNILAETSDKYGKCPKILYTKVSDKIAHANSVGSDQTAPEGAV